MKQAKDIPIKEPNIAIANIYTLIAGACSIFFIAFFYFVVKNPILSAIMVAVLVGVIINYFIQLRTRNFEIGAYVLLSMGAVIMFCLFVGGWENMGLIWPFAWLPATFWMNKGKGGRAFVFIFFAGTLFITILHILGAINLPYSPITLINFFAALAVFAALMIIYQNATINYENYLAYKRNLFEINLDALITVDMNGNIIDINRASEQMTGITRENLTNSNLSEYFSNPRQINEVYERTLTDGMVHNFPLKIQQSDGREIDILLNAILYTGEEAGKREFFIVLRDVTEAKKSEEAIKRLNTDLEFNIRQLEAVNKELEAFSYSVSHDLRAPLRAVHGFSQMLKENHAPYLNPEAQRLIDIISFNSKKMGTLIDDLLALSKLGRHELHKSEIGMNNLVEGVIADITRVIPHNADIIVKRLHNVKGDYSLIHLVMINLISNAVKYSSKQKQPVIEISSDDKNEELIFSVQDNGAGFDMQYADKLFGVFQRLHSDEEFEGTGVGLAIIQRIITKHGGRVWAKGKVNEGATFYFTLPKN